MMPDESTLYFIANLILFAVLLLYWAHLFRPNRVTDGMLLGTLLVFLSCQGMALLWSGLRLGPWAFPHRYLSMMFLIEAALLVYLLLERLLSQRGVGVFVLALAFAMHAYVILLIPLPIEGTLQVSPYLRSSWHLLHLLSALVAYGAYICVGGGAIGYFIVRFLTRSSLAPQLPSWRDCQMFTRRSLVIGFPWLSGSLVTGALWAQLTWGSYWSSRPEEIWLLMVWLILTITLHVRTMPGWQGRPLALLSLLGFILTLLTLPLLGQGLAPAS
jgi:ABC-type transport system involved in cytochrome c biogenesis permease subunit